MLPPFLLFYKGGILKNLFLLCFLFSFSSISFAQMNWKVEIPGYYSTGSATDQKGNIYISSTTNQLFSINKDGKINWKLDNVGSHPSIGRDGTIYVATTRTVNAINPDGSIKWTFTQVPNALKIFGPEVGPDGNIYAVATEGLGAFSLTSEGDLRWSLFEKYNRQNTVKAKLSFGFNEVKLQLYYYANNAFKAIDTTTGKLLTGYSGGLDPLTAPNGNIHIGTRAYAPNGKLLWNADIPTAFATLLDIDSLGNSYYNEYSSKLHVTSMDGSYLRSLFMPKNHYLTNAKASPASDVVLLTVATKNGTYLHALEAFNLNTLWFYNFSSRESMPVIGHIELYAPTGKAVYVTSTSASFGEKFYLHSFKSSLKD